MGAIGLLIITAIAAVALYAINRMERDKNKARIAPAAAARWREREPEPQPEPELKENTELQTAAMQAVQ